MYLSGGKSGRKIQGQQQAAEAVPLRRRRILGGKRLLRQRVAAYFTVEAAFIMPMVLILFAVLFYLGFYLYDRCLFSQDAYVLCFRGSLLKEEKNPEERVYGLRERQFGTKYFALDTQKSATRRDGKWIVMEGSARLTPAVFADSFLMPERVWTIHYSARARASDPVRGFRRYRRLRALAEQILTQRQG